MTQSLLKVLLASIFAAALVGCANENDDSTATVDKKAPHTGNEVLEETDVNPEAEAELADAAPTLQNTDLSKTLYVYASQVRARSTPEIVESNILGFLFENDEVQLVSDEEVNGFVEIKVLKAVRPLTPSEKVYVAKKYLSDKPVVKQQVNSGGNERSQVFMIQNLATEVLRVYKRNCNDGQCAHEMILETGVAIGEKKDGKMSAVGNYHFNKWVKFYQDHAARYPSWFDPILPPMPKPGASVTAWTNKKLMPNGGKVRGAFGWYTAFPGPNAYSQWTHGTLGWGKDGTKYIDATRGFWANLFTDPRSSGCTRNDNESIAYIRNIVPVGTPLIKIYAKEGYLDPDRSGYSKDKKQWNYILTKNGVRVDGEPADRNAVLAKGTPKDQWLEEGTYDADVYPDAKKFKKGGSGKDGKNGNTYDLNEGEFQGICSEHC
jgi:hypothetical protein